MVNLLVSRGLVANFFGTTFLQLEFVVNFANGHSGSKFCKMSFQTNFWQIWQIVFQTFSWILLFRTTFFRNYLLHINVFQTTFASCHYRQYFRKLFYGSSPFGLFWCKLCKMTLRTIFFGNKSFTWSKVLTTRVLRTVDMSRVPYTQTHGRHTC